MADYAGYVYSSYLTAAIVLVAVLVHALRRRRARQVELQALQAQAPDDGPSP